jgi:hypothetical protein
MFCWGHNIERIVAQRRQNILLVVKKTGKHLYCGTMFKLGTMPTYLQQVIEVNQGLLQRFLHVLHQFRIAQPFLYLFVLHNCGCRLFLRLGVSVGTADRWHVVFLVHLDELRNGKACSLDEVLVTPEMAFLYNCGILYYRIYKREIVRNYQSRASTVFFLVPINDSP